MIIVTGGAGFIGSNIIKLLNKIDYTNILVVDNLKNGAKYSNLLNLKIFDYIDKEDFLNSIVSNNYFGKIDIIFHEGACSSTDEWDGRYLIKNNYQYSKRILHFCIQHIIPLVYASSAAIYGNKTKIFIENEKYERPLNIYGYSKFLFDQYVRTVLPKAKSQICGLRYFNVYGPYEDHKGNMASIIFHLNSQICSNKHPTLFVGSEQFKRDFIYVNDVASVNIWAWKEHISGIFNCGTGKAETFKTIVDIVLNFHKKEKMEYIPFPEKLVKHYQTITQADLTKLRIAGYNKKFKSVNEGVTKYLKWLNYKC